MCLHNTGLTEFTATHEERVHMDCMLEIITDMSEDGNKLN